MLQSSDVVVFIGVVGVGTHVVVGRSSFSFSFSIAYTMIMLQQNRNTVMYYYVVCFSWPRSDRRNDPNETKRS